MEQESVAKSEEGNFGLSQTEELELAIDTCKDLIKKTDDAEHEKKRDLVKKLVELRIRLMELKDGPVEIRDQNLSISGHRFHSQRASRSNRYCERCNGIIWTMLQNWYRCRVCGYHSHEKCLNLVTRICAGVQVKESASIQTKICPERGLAAQKYRCAECKTKLTMSTACDGQEARLCDYSGCYFCPNCHWNDDMIIPARVIHNWDFTPIKVSRCWKQYLKIVYKRPLIKLEAVNPNLFNLVDELRSVRKMRSDILLMKCYLLCCKSAREQRLLLELRKRQHFVDNADTYSLKDLVDMENGELEAQLQAVIDTFTQHIKHECESCLGNGFVCELCSAKEVLFPFDHYVAVCRECFAVFHRICYDRRRKICPRCARREQRAISMSEAEDGHEETVVPALNTIEEVHRRAKLQEQSEGANESSFYTTCLDFSAQNHSFDSKDNSFHAQEATATEPPQITTIAPLDTSKITTTNLPSEEMSLSALLDKRKKAQAEPGSEMKPTLRPSLLGNGRPLPNKTVSFDQINPLKSASQPTTNISGGRKSEDIGTTVGLGGGGLKRGKTVDLSISGIKSCGKSDRRAEQEASAKPRRDSQSNNPFDVDDDDETDSVLNTTSGSNTSYQEGRPGVGGSNPFEIAPPTERGYDDTLNPFAE